MLKIKEKNVENRQIRRFTTNFSDISTWLTALFWACRYICTKMMKK